tara:strand:+ start:6016 stop:8769 length:2754 start_codon:yes stop_codon:yes gene_type:complete
MATFKTTELIAGLNKVVKSAKELLAISTETTKQLKLTAAAMASVSSKLDVGSAKGLKEFNTQLSKANGLVKVKIENDKAAVVAEQDLIRTEKLLTNAIIEEEKANQAKLKTQKLLTDAEIKQTKEAERRLSLKKKEVKELKKIEDAQIAAQKKVDALDNAYHRLTKSTNESQLELKKLSAEFGVGSKEAEKARKKFEKLDKQLREVNEEAKDGRRDVGRYKDQIKELAGELKGASGKASGFLSGLSGVNSKSGLAVAALTALGGAFLATEKGGNKAKDVLSQLKGGFNAATASAGGFISSLIDGKSITEAYSENLEGLTEKVKEQSNANLEATQSQRQNRIDLRETSQELARLRGEYELLSQQAGDSTTTLESQGDATIKQAEKAAEITNQELVVLDKQIDAINLQIESRKGLNNQDLLDERQEFVNQQVELEGQLVSDLATIGQERRQVEQDQWEQRLDFLFDASDRQKSITEKQLEDDSVSTEKRKEIFKGLKTSLAKTYAEIEREFQQVSGQNINIAEFANLEATAQAKLIQSMNLSEIGRNRLKEAVVEYLQVVQDLNETQADLNDTEEKGLSLQNEISIQRRKLSGEEIELEKEFADLRKKELEEKIESLDKNSIERLEKQKELNSLLLKDQQDLINKEAEAKKKADEESKKEDSKNEEERKQIIETSTDFAMDAVSAISEAKQNAAQRELDQSIRNQDIIAQGIENGSKLGEQSLAQEKRIQAEREAEIKRLESEALKLNALIALLQVWGQTGNLGETLAGFATVKTAASGISGAFYEGTDSVGSSGSETKIHGGRDGFNAMLDEGEMVFNAGQSNELRDLGFGTRDSMLDLARWSEMGVNKGGTSVVVAQDNSLVLTELREQNNILKNLHKKMPIHNRGLTDDPRYVNEVIKMNNVTSQTKRRARGTWER